MLQVAIQERSYPLESLLPLRFPRYQILAEPIRLPNRFLVLAQVRWGRLDSLFCAQFLVGSILDCKDVSEAALLHRNSDRTEYPLPNDIKQEQ